MDTQNTPIHFKLWHREFWYVALSNFLLTASLYSLLPVLPSYIHAEHGSVSLVVEIFLAYLVGLYLPGPFVSGLVQRRRRNHVCLSSILALLVVMGYYYLSGNYVSWLLIAAGGLLGVAFGLAKMTLASTLIIDTCESFVRTEANHASAWFGRLALAVGPFAGYFVYERMGFAYVRLLSICLAVASFYLLSRVRFPFKAPDEDVPRLSLDRFFLRQGFPLFVNLAMLTMSVGLVVSTRQQSPFYAYLLGGMLLAILSEKFVFANADLKSEAFAGSLALAVALLLLIFRQEHAAHIVAGGCVGFGIGIIGSRFLLFFIKLARHCERGTSQSSFFLAWESGLAGGLALGWSLVPTTALWVAFALVVVAFLLYNFLVHPWYLTHKNR